METKKLIKSKPKNENNFNQGEDLLVMTSGVNYQNSVGNLVKKLTSNKKGIYITFNKPATLLKSKFDKIGVNTANLYFIDCISNNMGGKCLKENAHCIQGPSSLTELSISLKKISDKNKFSFVIIDSIASISTYNSSKITEKFLHYMLSKLKTMGLTSFLIGLDDPKSKKIIPLISHFADKTISI